MTKEEKESLVVGLLHLGNALMYNEYSSEFSSLNLHKEANKQNEKRVEEYKKALSAFEKFIE
jgi:c-di-GMP-related signal transduction protein